MVKTRHVLALPLLLASMAMAGALSAARPALANPYGVAVIIGNKGYKNERVPEVAFAHRDAEAFKRYVLDVLRFDPNRVFDLRDATQAEMFTWFGNRDSHEGRLWRYLHPRHGSDVVVFYSGHGVPGLKDRRGYLLPSDADPDTPEINGYPIDLLYANVVKPQEAKSVRVFLDACFSGESDRGMLVRSASPVYVQVSLPEVAGEKLTVLTAASGTEVASWDEKVGHGMFTHHLLDALYGKADRDGDGRVTASEAKTYLDDTMTIAARVEFGRYQTASLNGVAGGLLASVGSGGTFPPRPPLDDIESGSDVGGEVVVVPPAKTAETLEKALGLTRADRVLVQHGLASLGYEIGKADGVFGHRTRSGIVSYQQTKGFPETGYLTRELSDALAELGEELQAKQERLERLESLEREKIAEGRRVTERRADDEAFARAKRLHTVSGYLEYLGRGGRHESEVRVLLAEASSATEDNVFEMREVSRVINSAVSYQYQKTVRRQVVESACYFDPNVENSMRCSWASSSGGADPFRMRQVVKRRLTEQCKQAGGGKCVLFWRNGALRFDGLAPEQSERLESVLAKIPDYDAQAASLSEGTGVSDEFRDWFPETKDYWEGIRKKKPGHNPHYAICANETGAFASSYMQGRDTDISHVRDMCVMKCQSFSELYSKEGKCYVVYEDGKFVNTAAEKATLQ